MPDSVLTPVTLWQAFDDSLPLKETKLNTYSIQSANITNVYFSGRQTEKGRVRIFGTYAEPIKPSKGSLLLLPDVFDTVDEEMVMYFANLGYNVLCVDYRGEYHDVSNYTKYPDDVSYANYINRGRTFDYVDETANKTCWYEWVSVARYAISYLKDKAPNNKIGIMGNKYASNICWQLAATDSRVDAAVFLFGAGWQAYDKIYKQSDDDIEFNEERCRFLAGIDAQSYAQYVECPVLYLSSTNNETFDVERAVDTLLRVKNQNTCWRNFITTTKSVLDDHCLNDVNLFFAKFLLGEKIIFPKTPTVETDIDDEDLVYTVKIDDLSNVDTVFLMTSSNDIIPSTRVWNNVLYNPQVKGNKLIYKKHIYDDSKFEISFVAVKYLNGLTISSNFSYKKTGIKSPSKVPSVIFSSTKLPTSFIIEDIKCNLLGNVFAEESFYKHAVGPNDIRGIYTNSTLTSYAIKNLANYLTDESFIKFDVYTPLNETISVVLKKSSGVEFRYTLPIIGGEFWQNINMNFIDFKDVNGIPLKKFDDIESVSIKTIGSFMINNFIVV